MRNANAAFDMPYGKHDRRLTATWKAVRSGRVHSGRIVVSTSKRSGGLYCIGGNRGMVAELRSSHIHARLGIEVATAGCGRRGRERIDRERAEPDSSCNIAARESKHCVAASRQLCLHSGGLHPTCFSITATP